MIYYSIDAPDRSTQCKCAQCGEMKTYATMRKSHTNGRHIVFAICMECENTFNRARRSHTPRTFDQIMRMRYQVLRIVSEKKSIPFTITYEYFIRLWNESDKTCPILGTALDLQGGKRNGADQDRLPSLDKIIPTHGYVEGNIRFISMTANRLKQNITIEQAESLLQYMKGVV
jgi:hypothetical protein